jgi:hypothetical protein
MKEHFKEQIVRTEALTEETIAKLRQNRIDNGLSTDSLAHLVLDDKFLFVMVDRDKGVNEDGLRNTITHLDKILEREIDSFCTRHTFLEMDESIPRFEEK